MKKRKCHSLEEIARRTGVNKSTVSRALHQHPNVSPETAAQILRTANEIGYLAKSARRNIALVLPSGNQEIGFYFFKLFKALRFELDRQKMSWYAINADQIEQIPERSTCGVISFDYGEKIAELAGGKFNLPIVCINDRPRHTDNIYSIFADGGDGIIKACRYLRGFGHREIGMISDNGSADGIIRRQAFHSENPNHPERCLQISDSLLTPETLLSLYRAGITALITEGEYLSTQILRIARLCKLRIPEDLSLIGWEIPYLSVNFSPPLTTLNCDYPLMAERAVQLLEAVRRNDRKLGDITMHYELIERESVSLRG